MVSENFFVNEFLETLSNWGAEVMLVFLLIFVIVFAVLEKTHIMGAGKRSLNVVMGLVDRLSQLNEDDEDIDTVIDETLAELLLQQDED